MKRDDKELYYTNTIKNNSITQNGFYSTTKNNTTGNNLFENKSNNNFYQKPSTNSKSVGIQKPSYSNYNNTNLNNKKNGQAPITSQPLNINRAKGNIGPFEPLDLLNSSVDVLNSNSNKKYFKKIKGTQRPYWFVGLTGSWGAFETEYINQSYATNVEDLFFTVGENSIGVGLAAQLRLKKDKGLVIDLSSHWLHSKITGETQSGYEWGLEERFIFRNRYEDTHYLDRVEQTQKGISTSLGLQYIFSDWRVRPLVNGGVNFYIHQKNVWNIRYEPKEIETNIYAEPVVTEDENIVVYAGFSANKEAYNSLDNSMPGESASGTSPVTRAFQWEGPYLGAGFDVSITDKIKGQLIGNYFFKKEFTHQDFQVKLNLLYNINHKKH